MASVLDFKRTLVREYVKEENEGKRAFCQVEGESEADIRKKSRIGTDGYTFLPVRVDYDVSPVGMEDYWHTNGQVLA